MILLLLCWLHHCQEQLHSIIQILVFSVDQDDGNVVDITQLVCSMCRSFLGYFEPCGIRSHKYDILIAYHLFHMNFSFYDSLLGILCYFAMFSF